MKQKRTDTNQGGQSEDAVEMTRRSKWGEESKVTRRCRPCNQASVNGIHNERVNQEVGTNLTYQSSHSWTFTKHGTYFFSSVRLL